jgi:hypothetical protein
MMKRETYAAVDANISALFAFVSNPTVPANKHVKRTIIPIFAFRPWLAKARRHVMAPIRRMALKSVAIIALKNWTRSSGK